MYFYCVKQKEKSHNSDFSARKTAFIKEKERTTDSKKITKSIDLTDSSRQQLTSTKLSSSVNTSSATSFNTTTTNAKEPDRNNVNFGGIFAEPPKPGIDSAQLSDIVRKDGANINCESGKALEPSNSKTNPSSLSCLHGNGVDAKHETNLNLCEVPSDLNKLETKTSLNSVQYYDESDLEQFEKLFQDCISEENFVSNLNLINKPQLTNKDSANSYPSLTNSSQAIQKEDIILDNNTESTSLVINSKESSLSNQSSLLPASTISTLDIQTNITSIESISNSISPSNSLEKPIILVSNTDSSELTNDKSEEFASTNHNKKFAGSKV